MQTRGIFGHKRGKTPANSWKQLEEGDEDLRSGSALSDMNDLRKRARADFERSANMLKEKQESCALSDASADSSDASPASHAPSQCREQLDEQDIASEESVGGSRGGAQVPAAFGCEIAGIAGTKFESYKLRNRQTKVKTADTSHQTSVQRENKRHLLMTWTTRATATIPRKAH